MVRVSGAGGSHRLWVAHRLLKNGRLINRLLRNGKLIRMLLKNGRLDTATGAALLRRHAG